ncbi:50S ribosomal protein L14e [Bacteroidota bacterium]
MYEVGRICVKIAGRDAGLRCVVVDVLDKQMVLIDGQTRRRKCNVKHLEPLKETIKIKKNASHSDVVSEFKKLKLEIKETKPKKAAERPKKQKKQKIKPVKENFKAIEKPVKAEKKEEKTESKTEKAKTKIEKPVAKKEVKKE